MCGGYSTPKKVEARYFEVYYFGYEVNEQSSNNINPLSHLLQSEGFAVSDLMVGLAQVCGLG